MLILSRAKSNYTTLVQMKLPQRHRDTEEKPDNNAAYFLFIRSVSLWLCG
jgi:hypothetical protein